MPPNETLTVLNRRGLVKATQAKHNAIGLATLSLVVTPEPLGQHFLADAGWREQIARALFGSAVGFPSVSSRDAAALSDRHLRDETWIEIGAGHGEMTELLARQASRLVAIELDARLLPRLRKLAARLGNVLVVAGDVLALDLVAIAGSKRFRVYGNLPYYITSPIVHRLLEHAGRLDAAFLVVQLEVAARITAQPGCRDYGYLSAIAQFHAQTEILLRIPPGAFRPPPKVASALVMLRPPGQRPALGIADERGFGQFLKACFAQKRKTLRNNLRALAEPGRTEQFLRDAGIAPQARAEELTLADFARLFAVLTLAGGTHPTVGLPSLR